MENFSVEQIIKIKPPAYAKVLKILLAVLAVISIVFIFVTYLGVILVALFAAASIIVSKYYNYEFEYTLVESELTIDRIMAKSYRKRCGTYNLARMDVLAPAGSDKLLSFEGRGCKKYNFTSNNEDAQVYVLYAPENNAMVCVLFEPDERLKDALWRIAPSKVTLV